MIINLSTIDFDGGGGGSAKPAKLQEKTTDIEANGTTNVFPDEDFDGISLLSLRANIPNASALDFNVIGYDEDFSSEINAKINDDIAYSKSLYDAWNPNNTSANTLYINNTKLVYAPNIDTSNVTSMSNMFQGCSNLTAIPNIDTSKVTYMNSMFNGCKKLTEVPNIDTQNVTSMHDLFAGCSSLTKIPQLEMQNVTNIGGMFHDCYNLESLPLLNCVKVTNIAYIFAWQDFEYLTELGGFKDLKIDWKDNYGLAKLPYLSYQSILNVLNNLYDFRGNGDTTTTRTIKFHSNALALMTDEDKAIATNKGWVIS